jgi:hypothetical protein
MLNNILQYFTAAEALLLIGGAAFAVYVFLRGIAPALWRLGNGLATRKIALFAKGDNVATLRALLLDSGLFQEKNIIEICAPGDIGRAERASVYLVFWQDWARDINEILYEKPDECPLIVYSPYDSAPIPPEEMKKLDGKRHTAVTNFRGRLLNDVVASMITTSYEKS